MPACFISNKSITLLLPILILCCLVEYVKGTNTSCSSSVQGTAANITCHFSDNRYLVDYHIGLVIQKYALNDTSSYHANPVLDCMWENNITMYCVEQPGYSFNKIPTDTLILGITNLTSDFEGRYECRVVDGTSKNRHQQCILKRNRADSGHTETKTRVRETYNTSHVPERTPFTSSPEIYLTSQNTTPKKSDTHTTPTYIIVGIVVGIVVAGFVTAVSIVVWRRRCNRNGNAGNKEGISLVPERQPEI